MQYALQTKRLGMAFVLLFSLLYALCGCSPHAPTPLDKRMLSSYESMGRSERVQVVQGAFVQAKEEKDAMDPIFARKITLRAQASFPEIVALVRELIPLHVTVISANELDQKSAAQPSIARYLEGEENFVPGDYPKRLSVNHNGSLKTLLEELSGQTGYGWEYRPETKTIVFARTLVKTFVLHAAPGQVSWQSQLTNKSRENKGASNLGSSVNSVAHTSETSAEIAELYQGKLTFDLWQDTLTTVRALLSPIGHAEGSQGAGTISVRDRPENLRQIGRYIAKVNARLQKQVAMKVNVYALELQEDSSVGFDLSLIVPSVALGASHVGVNAGSLTQASSMGTATATILDGHLKDSSAMLEALKTIGQARQITSAGIVALNNQPAPVEAIQKTAYLAATSVETHDKGSETELTPGEVTTGFSMTITPHVVEKDRVILQYTVHLSSLDKLESFESNNTKIQLPKVSSRAFAQKASMRMGQTLILAGFQQASEQQHNSAGLFSLHRKKTRMRSLIVITIEVANAERIRG